MILSICVVTMNRANQLKEALESCLACDLPKETEFVVVDNASTDDTEKVVKSVLGSCGYPYYYELMPSNLGCGGGRNYAFEKATGKYIYVLDDDAVVSGETPHFFVKALSFFEKYDDIVTLTTQIYDTAWKKNRLDIRERRYKDGLYLCKMFCGGSHFLRKDFFFEPPYLSNKYGYEELKPSFEVVDEGKVNVFCPDLLIIHKPVVDKWNFNDEKNHALLINECAVMYAVKKMMFPQIFIPLLEFAYRRRCKKHLGKIPNGQKRANEIVKETMRQYKIEKRIKIKTVFKMYKNFGISIF